MATPVQSFVGGLGLALSVHSLLICNGRNFGVSGFIHAAAVGNEEGVAAVAGLVAGGVIIGLMEGSGPEAMMGDVSKTIFSGMLIGIGSKLSNGCTSGHMICGLSKFSFRSFIATLVFFCTGVVTAHVLHADTLVQSGSTDWSLGSNGWWLITLYVLALIPPLVLSYSSSVRQLSKDITTAFFVALSFAIALRLSNLSDPAKVLGFLILPFHSAFDPSLVYLAAGALPLASFLYHFCQRTTVQTSCGTTIDPGATFYCKLVTGAAIFGIGWGISGICPGPGLINVGRSLAGGSNTKQFIVWVLSVMLGGVLANKNMRKIEAFCE